MKNLFIKSFVILVMSIQAHALSISGAIIDSRLLPLQDLQKIGSQFSIQSADALTCGGEIVHIKVLTANTNNHLSLDVEYATCGSFGHAMKICRISGVTQFDSQRQESKFISKADVVCENHDAK